MSVTQINKLVTNSIARLQFTRAELLDARMLARVQQDWKADEEITCAVRNIDSAVIALTVARG